MTAQEKAQFFQQFAALLNSGMSVQQSLNLLGNTGNPSFRRYLQKVKAAVGSGENLAAAIALDSRYFDGWTRSLIRLAEYSGALPKVFQRLAESALTQQRRARIYRSVWMSAIATVWSLLVVVAVIFNPNPYGLIRLRFWLHAFGLGLLLVGVSIVISRYPSRSLYKLAASFPILNKVVQAQSLLDFSELALPLSCGVPMLTAVDLVRDRILNPTMAANLGSAIKGLRTGGTLSRSLQGKIPPQALQMIHTGEETGHLDAALQRVSEYYDNELERALCKLQGIFRPLSILAVGGLVVALGIRAIRLLTNFLPG